MLVLSSAYMYIDVNNRIVLYQIHSFQDMI
jgi:hypothetical protein